MPRKKPQKRKLGIIDLETDPFKFGRKPLPFLAGFYDGVEWFYFWGKDCIPRLMEFLSELPDPYLIYAHNGGGFDYFYFLDHLENPMKLINGRIAKCKFKHHELRDSYSIMPFPLDEYSKLKIDYQKFEAVSRETFKDEIIEYWKQDCKSLYELVEAFLNRFGPMLTVGATAIKEIQKYHPFERVGQHFDEEFRDFFYGGRVECFKTGIFKGKKDEFKIYDVNGMYSYAMKEFEHPTGSEYHDVSNPKINSEGELIGYEGQPYFAIIVADNDGCLPFRTKTGLDFNQKFAQFHATSHEIKVGLKYKKIKIRKIIAAYAFEESQSYGKFVDIFMGEKAAAKESGDKITYLICKYVGNSGYGKFGQNPDNFFDFYILKNNAEIPDDWIDWDEDGKQIYRWELYESHEEFEIWRKPSPMKLFYNVATAASITGAARSTLFEAYCNTTDAYYCDTDALLIRGKIKNIRIHKSELGAWDLEKTGDEVAIAGKKMYALMSEKKCVKLASKGVRFTHTDIFNVCRGEIVNYKRDAPKFKLSGKHIFVERNIKKRS